MVAALANYNEDSIYTLGSTGDTVVYVFPGGDALIERDGARAAERLQAHGESSSVPATSPIDETALEQKLLQMGLIIPGQYTVAAYDRETTGISLIEALEMRGWISHTNILHLL